MTQTILGQLQAIRDSGVVNMFDYRAVQRIAFERNYHELVLYIEDNPKRYATFILTGKEPE